jgi:chloramphenicol O-acetyltransferase type A
MRTELNPEQTSRALAYQYWSSSVVPMVTVVKKIDVTKLVRISKKHNYKINMLMCWCIGKAASTIPECYLLSEGDKLYRYDALSIQVIVQDKNGKLAFCDVPYNDDLVEFNKSYLERTRRSYETGEDNLLPERLMISTSALPSLQFDVCVNQYNPTYKNAFLVWGQFSRYLWKYSVNMSLNFCHLLMDGSHVATLFNNFQKAINDLA